MNILTRMVKRFLPPVVTEWTLPTRAALMGVASTTGSSTPSWSMVQVQEVFATLGIPVFVIAQRRSPACSQYKLVLETGTLFAGLESRKVDIALALASGPVRIAPGVNGSVTLELPEANNPLVALEVDTVEFRRFDRELPIHIGIGADGTHIVTDLADAPHLLIAGTTGSGKSVAMNSLIAGLMYARSPDQVEFYLVDPKVVEFSIYDGAPFVSGVITETKQAMLLFEDLVINMAMRYKIMAKHGVRTIAELNQGIWPKQHMKRKVVIVDEMADLVHKNEPMKDLLQRIAQKGRAAGIHLVLATQKPLVPVIGSVLKANMPTRLAFKVQNSMDSRVILDQTGAEFLAGKGDGLYQASNGTITRIQAPWVPIEEIKKLISYWRNHP